LRKILKQYKDANLWRLLKDGIDRLIKLSKAGSLMLKTMQFWCKILLLIEQQQHGWICSLPGQICTVCVPRPSHFYLPRPCIELLPLSACHCSEPLSRVSRSGREVLPPSLQIEQHKPSIVPGHQQVAAHLREYRVPLRGCARAYPWASGAARG